MRRKREDDKKAPTERKAAMGLRVVGKDFASEEEYIQVGELL